MKISPAGIELIKQFEKCELKAYKGAADRASVYTIGWGHVILPQDQWQDKKDITKTTITQAFADDLFVRDIARYTEAVLESLTHEPSQQHLDAMVSLCYNIGPGNFRKSDVLKNYNAFDLEQSAMSFRSWISSAGKKRLGLVRRRAVEKYFFVTAKNVYSEVYAGSKNPFTILDINPGVVG